MGLRNLVAHRGAGWRTSKDTYPNSLAALCRGATCEDFSGVETDVRLCTDGFVMIHDRALPDPEYQIRPDWVVRETNLRQLRRLTRGKVATLQEVRDGYPWERGSPLLLDLKFRVLPTELVAELRRFPPELTWFGVRSPRVAKQCSEIAEGNESRVVGFPSPFFASAEDLMEAGAGIMREWSWQVTPARIKQWHDLEMKVLVMMQRWPLFSVIGDAPPAQVERVERMGADLILLNHS